MIDSGPDEYSLSDKIYLTLATLCIASPILPPVFRCLEEKVDTKVTPVVRVSEHDPLDCYPKPIRDPCEYHK